MRALPLAALLMLTLALPGCQTTNNAKSEAEAVYTYTDWWYASADFNNSPSQFVAKTATQREGATTKSYLSLVTIPGQCFARYFRIAIEQETPRDNEFKSQPFHGEMRIDDQPAIPVDFVYFTHTGKKYIWVDTFDILTNKTLLQQFAKGQILRFQFTLEKKAYTLRFTLRNHLKAITTAMDNCDEATAFKAGTPGKTTPAKAGDQDDDARYFKK